MLTEGDIIELVEGHQVYTTVPEHFLYANRPGSPKLARGRITIGDELAHYAGRYVVYKVEEHQVFCERLDNTDVRVDFYQSGNFAELLRVDPVGRAERHWVE